MKEFKSGDICMIFGNPIKMEFPIGQAKLIEKIKDKETLSLWHVEYLNDEGHTYEAFIKRHGKGQ